MKNLYQLKKTLTFDRPRSQDILIQYAVLINEKQVTIEKGSWLLDLSCQLTWDEQTEYLYRLACGQVVAREQPLIVDEEAQLVTSEQAIVAMNTFRTLKQAAFEDWGIHIEDNSRSYPFRMIKCPLCGQTEFTNIEFASTWCNGCNAQFQITYTNDMEAVVNCTWSEYYYHYNETRLLLPHSNFFRMYLVLKNFGDAHDLSCADCNCDPSKPSLTGQNHPSLRSGLHTCRISEISGWKFFGWGPDLIEFSQKTEQLPSWIIEDQIWPRCAYIRTTALLDDALYNLRRLCSYLSKIVDTDDLPIVCDLDDLKTDLNILKNHLFPRASPPLVYGIFYSSYSLPDIAELSEDECYVLHHWLVTKDKPVDSVWPVWYVVTPMMGEKLPSGSRDIDGWEVIRKDICPHCVGIVTEQDLAASALHAKLGQIDFYYKHKSCRKVWEAGSWAPYEEALDAAAGH